MEALGFHDNIPSAFDVLFRGVAYSANISPKVMPDGRPGNFQDINLVGSIFLAKARCALLVDYMENEVTLTFK